MGLRRGSNLLSQEDRRISDVVKIVERSLIYDFLLVCVDNFCRPFAVPDCEYVLNHYSSLAYSQSVTRITNNGQSPLVAQSRISNAIPPAGFEQSSLSKYNMTLSEKSIDHPSFSNRSEYSCPRVSLPP